jgi:hypothetical protein
MGITEKLEPLKLRTKHGWQLRRDLIRISGAGGDMSAQVATLSGILKDELGSPLGCDDYVHDLRLLVEGVSSAEYEAALEKATGESSDILKAPGGQMRGRKLD